MIRLLGRLLRLSVLLGLLGGIIWRLWPMVQMGWTLFDPDSHSEVVDPRLTTAADDTVYLLDDGHWLEFPINSQNDRLKIITNATVPPAEARQPNRFWVYHIALQLINSRGQIVKEEIYYQRTAVRWYQSPDAEPMTAAFYLNDPFLPANSQTIMLNLQEASGATRLRLRLNQRPADMKDVVVRIYTQNFRFDQTGVYGWQRLSRRLQEQLGKASVYGVELLSLAEQINLMRQRWSPIAPGGVLGRDYYVRKLYVVLDVEAESPRLPVLPAGLYVNRDLRGIIPVPEPGGTVDLELIDVAELVASAGSMMEPGVSVPDLSPVQLIWHGQKPSQKTERLLSNQAMRWTDRFEPGLLEIIAERPVVIRASLRQEHNSHLNLLGESTYQRLYRLDSGRTLEFRVAHAAGQPTFWRLDARLELPMTATTVHYALLDDRERVLRQGELHITNAPSVYDWLVSRKAFFDPVSEPASYAFALPKPVAKIRLHATASVLLAGYTRPSNLPRRVRVPEDYLPGFPKDRGQPFWFPVLPVAAAELLREGQTVLMMTQSPPPQPDPEILAGRYDWRDYYPEGVWRGRYLLSPRESDLPLRPQARPSLFRPLPVGTPTALALSGLPGRETVDATVLVLRDSDTPGPARILIDGQTIYADTLLTRYSEIRLPPQSTGTHILHIETGQPPGRWFINYAGETGDSLIRRIGYRLDDRQALEFIYAKTRPGEEILTGILRTPTDQRQSFRLRVTLETPNLTLGGPVARLTAREWIYDIRPDHRQPLPVSGTSHETVGAGRHFFLPLGDDLPVGSYRVRMRLEKGHGYLLFYQVMPGEPAVLELFSEEKK